MNSGSALDVAAFAKLEQMGGKAFAVQMIDLFVSYVPEKLAEARAAQQAGDLARVQKAVHPIKSSAGNIGARPMRELAERIEQLASEQRGAGLDGMLVELEATYLQVKEQLQAQRNGLVT